MGTLDGSFRKSSYSSTNGECVEVGQASTVMIYDTGALRMTDTPYRKSSYSDTSGDCVEAGIRSGAVAVRDTKDAGHGLVLRFGATAWEQFTASLR